MRSTKSLFAALALVAAMTIAPAANAAVTVKVIMVGSSAMFTGTAVAAFNNLAGGGGVAKKYTKSGNCSGGPCAYILDTRNGSIVNQSGNVWIVWDNGGANANVWAYIAVDSTVGVRAFYANPKPTLRIDLDVLTTGGSNLIANSLTSGDGEAATVPNAIYTALNAHAITVGMTDIRPEDALFATKRALTKYNAKTLNGLGYGTSFKATPVGSNILSSSSGSFAQPVMFAIKGKDPFTLNPITKTAITRALGASPVVFLTNNRAAANGPLSTVTDASRTALTTVFGGDNCNASALGGSNAGIKPVLREALSGTMNTTEYGVFRVFTAAKAPTASQEKGVNPATQNPLGGNPPGSVAGSCVTGGGFRQRAIGTGQSVSQLKATDDAIAYAFFSFGNVSSIQRSDNWHYVQLDGVDPIFHAYGGTDPGQPAAGQLPGCTVDNNGTQNNNGTGGCAANDVWDTTGSGGGERIDSYPHVRDGSYRAWSVLRSVYESSDTAADALFDALQANINKSVADFVPFDAVAASGSVPADDGLPVYRSHFKNQIAGKNTPEAGGDMGGCILSKPASNSDINLHQSNGGGPGPGNCILFTGALK
jgi:hypothetical protein